MKSRWHSCVFLLCVMFIIFLSAPLSVSAAPSESASGVGSAEKDQETLDKLGRTSPGKLDELDSKLADAMILYYDGKYGQALPIFNEIASVVQTTDIMWWIGTSAMNSGDLNLAAQKFQQMLSIDPNLQRVRLELASVYFQLGKYKDARQELETVKASKPPEEVRNNIDRLLAAIDEATRKLRWNIRASLGVQWDSNVSAGPDNRNLNVVGGGSLTLSADSSKQSDTGYVTNLGANVLYNFGEKQLGLAWNTTLDYYSILYHRYSQFNYAMIDAATGPWWIGRNFIVKAPFGYQIQYFGNSDLDRYTTAQRNSQVQGYLSISDWFKTNASFGQDNSLNHLSYITHFDPNIEYFFGQHFSLKGTFNYTRETYAQKWNQDIMASESRNEFDNQTRRYEINPNIYLFNRQHILSLAAGYENSDADARINTYDNKYYSASYFMRFPTQTEVFLKFQRNYKDYKDRPILYTDWRYDTRTMYTVVVSQGFMKHFFASLAYNYIDNSSNADIYTFDKRTFMLSIGAYF